MVERPPQVLAIVPARGGSKSIPRKNIKLLSGFPLIAYSIAAGLQAKSITRAILSTDDEEVAEVGRQWGAETPFNRPAEFARDMTPDLPVFVHALEWLKANEGYEPDVVVQLRPTTPVRPHGLVDEAVEKLLEHPDATCVRGVVPAGENPHKMWRVIDSDSPMQNLLDVPGIDEPYNAPRQILPPIYWQTGHVDVILPKVIVGGSMSGKNVYPLIIDSKFKVDIDNIPDWERTEWLMEGLGNEIVRPK